MITFDAIWFLEIWEIVPFVICQVWQSLATIPAVLTSRCPLHGRALLWQQQQKTHFNVCVGSGFSFEATSVWKAIVSADTCTPAINLPIVAAWYADA
jgi:hypothetical protein